MVKVNNSSVYIFNPAPVNYLDAFPGYTVACKKNKDTRDILFTGKVTNPLTKE